MHKISDHFSRDFLPCIRNVVQKKAILLQHQHLELLLQVIAEVIAPSHRSSPTKSKLEDASPIFNDIVAILTTLIRQRRDLLQAFIPQLSQLLGTLTSLLRVPHAQLGGAQQRLVAEAFPSWLNPFEQSLGEADARALARLLTSITARTQTLALRSRKRSREGDAIDRTDFLSKPFDHRVLKVRIAAGSRIVRLEQTLNQLASRDSLTQCWNRRMIDELFDSTLAEARRKGSALCVMMVDIDHFKAINDTYGHAIGDIALQHMVAILNQNPREYDQVGRYGGEEFIVVLPTTDRDSAWGIAERVRSAVEYQPSVLSDGREISMTVSIGLAMFEPKRDPDRRSLMERADQALYKAKRSGRNRIIVAD